MVKVSVNAECIITHLLMARANAGKALRTAIHFSDIEDFVGLLYYKAKSKGWDMDCFWISRNTFQEILRDNSNFVYRHGLIKLAKGASIQFLKERYCAYLNPEICEYIQEVAKGFYDKKPK